MSYPIWNFRPTALNHGDTYYEKVRREELFQHYLHDAKKAQSRARKVEEKQQQQDHPNKFYGGIPNPPKKFNLDDNDGFITTSTSSTTSCSPHNYLRTAQWNIHSLYAPWEKDSYARNSFSDLHHTKNVANTLLQTKAQVMILNEYHSSNQAPLKRLLEIEGYTCYAPRNLYNFPTVIFTNLPVVKTGTFRLDSDRSAVYVEVMISDDGGDSPPQYVTVYGTHLDHMDVNKGKRRLEEAQVLLQHVDTLSYDNDLAKNPTLIIGDLNQQRKKDYTEEEWHAISLNKTYRRAPFDDGVASLLEDAGFFSCYDPFVTFPSSPSLVSTSENQKQGDDSTNDASDGLTTTRSGMQCKCNWKPDQPPPATHWSSTVIDFAYARGSQDPNSENQSINIEGVYVSPSSASDHRMVVCDWKITR